MANKLSHFTEKGDAQMVDVGKKPSTNRSAVASGDIFMSKGAFEQLMAGTSKKGDVLGVARLAAIMGAKKTSDLIPLCHPLPITHITIDFNTGTPQTVTCIAKVETYGQTGIEMEALTAVNVALLTVYDMCKAADKGMQISNIKLLSKTGGKSDYTIDKE